MCGMVTGVSLLRIVSVTALVLGAVLMAASLMNRTGQAGDSGAQQDASIEENARQLVEAFYTCPGSGNPGPMKERNRILRTLSATPPPDPGFFCTKVLQGTPSVATVTDVRTIGVRNDRAGVAVDVSLESETRTEQIKLDLTLTRVSNRWLVDEVA